MYVCIPAAVADSQAKSIIRRVRCSAVNPGRTGLPSDGTARSTRVWKGGGATTARRMIFLEVVHGLGRSTPYRIGDDKILGTR